MQDSSNVDADTAMEISGVAMIVRQGNLDHWFGPSLWGNGSNPRPSGLAFDIAVRVGLLEKHHAGGKYRLTNLGRKHRSSPGVV